MRKTVKGGFIVAFLIFLDQLTKLWAKTNLKGHKDIVILDKVFSLHYLENQGAAFGILQNKQAFFLIMTTIILCGVIYAYYRLPNSSRYRPLEILSLFIAAGAVGNLIDRVSYGYVIDFLYFELIDFPVFNVADCYVTCSAFFLVLLVLFYYKEEDFAFLSRKGMKP